jgi:gamma-glutamylcyclotransferase (GGCT)/AIG2-like uncharacterized protein YtfP
MIFLFVYGTLRKDANHPMAKFLNQQAKYIGEGFAIGKLYQVSWYPAFKKSLNKKDVVKGDVYQINEKNKESLIKTLDEYEGDEYDKEHLEIEIDNRKIQALVYIYTKPIDENKRIISGDFLKING